jgi:hypothetical protein
MRDLPYRYLVIAMLIAAVFGGVGAATYPPEDQPLLLVTSQEEVGIHVYSFKKQGHFCFLVDKHGYAATLECPR